MSSSRLVVLGCPPRPLPRSVHACERGLCMLAARRQVMELRPQTVRGRQLPPSSPFLTDGVTMRSVRGAAPPNLGHALICCSLTGWTTQRCQAASSPAPRPRLRRLALAPNAMTPMTLPLDFAPSDFTSSTMLLPGGTLCYLRPSRHPGGYNGPQPLNSLAPQMPCLVSSMCSPGGLRCPRAPPRSCATTACRPPPLSRRCSPRRQQVLWLPLPRQMARRWIRHRRLPERGYPV